MDEGLVQYLKQRVETLTKRNDELMRLKKFLIDKHPDIYKEYKDEIR